ncbi:hypothetical protein L3Y34_019558 [Caenorhabditis briggsae]|uniref:F-box associated domain-containing protein n=1 Tax=Caenorhabditis briggsae TaxID=6238 RepID=A0AAE9DQ52_CAEBR|nr:hypothetical protein L3Y34_019558 [Caenorhabditis briggsae]
MYLLFIQVFLFPLHRPTDGFQRFARLLEAENQKFSVITYRIGVRDSVTAETFTVCTGHTTSERSSTDRKNEKKKKQPRATSRLDCRLMDIKREKCDENIESIMLSYPSSLCIFKHLDVNRRLQLAAKCPSLRTAHRIAPMKIEDLEIQESSITINNCVQEFEAISPTEIQYTYTRMGCDWKSSVQTLHTQATVTQIIKSLVANFFGKNAKIHVKNLKTTSGLLEAFGPILKLSKPLEKLRTSVKGPWDSIFSNPILRSARWLVLDDLTETIDWADTLKPLENPRIQMEGSQIDQDVLHRMVWDWLEKPRPIGYRFTTPISVRVIMRSFYVEFGAFWKDIPTEYNGNTYCLVIHTTDTYELVVYSQRNPNLVFDPRLSDDESKLALFTLEVVPLGKTLPCSTRFA